MAFQSPVDYFQGSFHRTCKIIKAISIDRIYFVNQSQWSNIIWCGSLTKPVREVQFLIDYQRTYVSGDNSGIIFLISHLHKDICCGYSLECVFFFIILCYRHSILTETAAEGGQLFSDNKVCKKKKKKKRNDFFTKLNAIIVPFESYTSQEQFLFLMSTSDTEVLMLLMHFIEICLQARQSSGR